MNTLALVLILLLANAAAGAQDKKYAPLSQVLMEPNAEIALARSAAPDNVSGPATVKVLTPDGFKVAVEGQNGFVCLVLPAGARRPTVRSRSATTSMSPICARRSVSTRSPRAP